MENTAPSGSIQQARELTHARQRLAKLVLLSGLALIGILATCIVGATLWIFLSQDTTKGTPLTADHALGYLQTLLTGILPVIASWIAAVIAFYFARENFDAATQNTKALLEINRPGLETITAREVMVPFAKVSLVRTPEDDGLSVSDEILPRFQATGLGRIPVVGAGDTGLGVYPDSTLSQFVIDKVKAGSAMDQVTLSTVLSDPDLKKIGDASVVFVTPNASLSAVKDQMEKKSKALGLTCRDAFVTESGDAKGKVLGYLSSVDINKHGAFK